MQSAPRIGWMALLLAMAGQAHAGHPLVSDDTGTQGTGHWQVELNTDFTHFPDPALSDWSHQFNATLTRGVAANLDLSLAVPWLWLPASGTAAQHGVGDMTVLAKWRFHDGSNGWSLALRPEITLPTGRASQQLGNGRATAALTLISTWTRGRWTWLANAGISHNDNKLGDRKQLWAASTAIAFTAGDRLTWVADIGANRAAEVGAGTERFGLLGAIFHFGQDVDLDVGWQRSLSPGPASDTPGAGLTLRW
ncbi:MAG: transporter [Proteobacteria bacterium]|nr:transporter [Pseudomonadota bacterium]